MRILQCKWDKTISEMILQLGGEPVVIVNAFDKEVYAKEIETSPEIKLFCIDTFENLSSIMALAGELAQLGEKFDYIINLTYEGSQYAAGILANALNINGYGLPVMLQNRDKRLMKRRVSASGINVAKFFSITDITVLNLEEKITTFIDFPLVVKPVSQAGTRGVKKIHNPTELKTWLHNMKLEFEKSKIQTHYMAEEFLESEEYYVDTIWSDGKPIYTFVGRYQTPMLTLTENNNFLFDSRYFRMSDNPELFTSLSEINKKACLALGVTQGVTHAEYYLTQDQSIYFGECAARAAGGAHDDSIALMYGEGLKQLAVRAILGNFRGAPPKDFSPKIVAGAINLRPSAAGKIIKLSSKEELLSVPGTAKIKHFKKPGDVVNPNEACDWCILVNATSESPQGLHQTMHQLQAKFQCLTE